MLRSAAAAFIAIVLLSGGASAATDRSPSAGLAEVGAEARTASRPVQPATRARAALAETLGPQGVISIDNVTGTPRIVARLDGFLTQPSSLEPDDIALGFVRSHLAAFGLTGSDLATLHLRRTYTDIEGVHHLSWMQQRDGVPVFAHGLEAAVSHDGRLVNVTGAPVHDLRVTNRTRIGAARAEVMARFDSGGSAIGLPSDRADEVLFDTGHGARLAWRSVVWVDGELRSAVIDASSGRVLWSASLTRSDAAGTGIAVDYYPGADVPYGAGIPSPVTFPVASGRALSGNNAHVYTDVNDDNRPSPKDEIHAKSGVDFAYAPKIDATTGALNCSTHFYCTWDNRTPRDWRRNRRYFAVQLYYYLNQFHDHLKAAPIGFTAAAGNFQVHNPSGQGKGKDPVQGQAIDGANTKHGNPDGGHLNNANMSTDVDGVPPVMQMYLQRATPYWPTIPSGDSGTEAETVYHEYTHGLSDRLVAYPDGIPSLNSAQAGAMSEAWSDWYAVDYTAKRGWFYDTSAPGDGIVYRYSAGDSLAFRTAAVDCPVGVAVANCPGPDSDGGPGGYTYGDFGTIVGRPEVHSDGEIWVQTLWDLRQDVGSHVAESLVTRGMELSVPDPSFLDMRNAILQSDEVVFGGAHSDTIWQVFARRGMGFYASTTGGNDVHPVEDFELPPDCSVHACGSLSGKVVDRLTGAPISGVTVSIQGPGSGGYGLSSVTGPAGHYRIPHVPFHTYPSVSLVGAAYEPVTVTPERVVGDVTLNRRMILDWASSAAGARVVGASRPHYGGCEPRDAFDLSLGRGWGSDVPGPRRVVVRLAKPVDIESFAVASGGACGDRASAGVRRFSIQTRGAAGTTWRRAAKGTLDADGRLSPVPAIGAPKHVRFVRFTMLTNHGDGRYMDVLEVSARGR